VVGVAGVEVVEEEEVEGVRTSCRYATLANNNKSSCESRGGYPPKNDICNSGGSKKTTVEAEMKRARTSCRYAAMDGGAAAVEAVEVEAVEDVRTSCRYAAMAGRAVEMVVPPGINRFGLTRYSQKIGGGEREGRGVRWGQGGGPGRVRETGREG